MTDDEPRFELVDVALLVRCPRCGATAERACLNEWASVVVPTHPIRLKRAEQAITEARERVPDALPGEAS